VSRQILQLPLAFEVNRGQAGRKVPVAQPWHSSFDADKS
jgi:hypothetical protein